MADTDYRLPNQHSAWAAREQKYARRLRETYVPSKLRRWIREEGQLMMRFDVAADVKEMLEILGGLVRLRLLILRGIGWPKEPSVKPGRLPAALDSVRHHDPLGDLDVETMAMVVPPAPEPENIASAV